MATKLTTQVLIVGAGPTGLMAANQLMRYGIDFIIIDTKSGPTVESRAIAVTARSLEIYQQMGLSDHAIEHGKMMTVFNLYTNGKKKAEIKIGEIGKGFSEFSYMLAFEQSKNEELLVSNLVKNGRMVHWEHEFIKLLEYKTNVEALVKNKDGELIISAEYVIACDGARSPIRHQLNFRFDGGTYDHKFFVADTVMRWDNGYERLIVSPGDDNFCALFPLKGSEAYRVIGTLPAAYKDKEDITFADIEATAKKTLKMDLNFEKVNWFSVYKLHHRVVDKFSQDRVFLAGDSAHIHSPAGGQGMNTGLQDAYNLAWKMAMVLKKQAKPAILNTYNEERLPFAQWLMNFTDRAFNMMTSGHWFVKLFRKYVALKIAPIVIQMKFARPKIFKTISQTAYSYSKYKISKSATNQKLTFAAGDRLPYFVGEQFYLKFTQPCFHLLHLHSSPLDSSMQEKITKTFPFPVQIVEDQALDKWKALGVQKELFILVRPDNYMGFVTDGFDEKMVGEYLKNNLEM